MPPKLSGETLIAFRQDNPKKRGSKAHDRYEQYKAARTVDEALGLGAARCDLSNDHKLGFLVVAGEELVGAPQRGGGGAGGPCDRAEGAVVAALPSPAKRRAPARRQEADSQLSPQRDDTAAWLQARPEAHELPAAQHSQGTADHDAPACSAIAASAAGSQDTLARRPPEGDVDLSFVTFDNKPMRYIKRTMGEAKRLLCSRGVEEGRQQGYEFRLLDRANLAKWAVQLRDLNPDGALFKDLQKLGLDPSVDLEFSLPDGFPMEPPFARVVYPHLSGGYVFQHGGICFEPLTAKGWAPSMTLPALAIAIKGIFDFGNVRCSGAGDRGARTVRQFTEEGARQDHSVISSAHHGGEGETYGSLKHYRS